MSPDYSSMSSCYYFSLICARCERVGNVKMVSCNHSFCFYHEVVDSDVCPECQLLLSFYTHQASTSEFPSRGPKRGSSRDDDNFRQSPTTSSNV